MKENQILVAYATTSGSTQEIAEFVAGELTRLGMSVSLRRCREVASVDGYGAVVLGAPLYMFHLHKDGARFLQRHQKALSRLPLAVFAGGPYGPNAEADAVEVRKNLDAELAKFPMLRPASVEVVGGRFDPARLRFPYSLIPALRQSPASDARDWEKIRAWAASIPALMANTSNPPVAA